MSSPAHYSGIKWRFETANFVIRFRIERDHNYIYDGDDENGETQAALNSGDYVAFNSFVEVEYEGEVIGTDALFGSVYGADTVADFWTAHRADNPMERNSSIMRLKRGKNACICHYFPDMVREAVREARREIVRRKRAASSLPFVREV
jgi:hypothetical protein